MSQVMTRTEDSKHQQATADDPCWMRVVARDPSAGGALQPSE
jgi:hypothetical protein